MRWLRHLFTTPYALRRRFPPSALAAIDAATGDAEREHGAEIRCVIEAALPLRELLRGTRCRQRAARIFAELGVWDTAANNGVLVYVLIAERDIEIVADRGFDDLVSNAEWHAVCARLEDALRAGRYEAGLLAAVQEVGRIAARHFPPPGEPHNELPDRPMVL